MTYYDVAYHVIADYDVAYHVIAGEYFFSDTVKAIKLCNLNSIGYP